MDQDDMDLDLEFDSLEIDTSAARKRVQARENQSAGIESERRRKRSVTEDLDFDDQDEFAEVPVPRRRPSEPTNKGSKSASGPAVKKKRSSESASSRSVSKAPVKRERSVDFETGQTLVKRHSNDPERGSAAKREHQIQGHPNGERPRRKLTPEQRAERQRKRKIHRIKVYCIWALFILLVVTGLTFAIFQIVKHVKNAKSDSETEAITEEITEPETVAEEPTVVDTPDTQLDTLVDSYIEEMTLEEKVAGLFMLTPESLTGTDVATRAGDGTKEALAKYPVGGLIYFSQNIESEDQLQEMLLNTTTYSSRPMFLAIDEEGGTVARLGNSENVTVDQVDTMEEIGAAGDATKAYNAGSIIGNYLSEYGFNLDMAPVADVLTNADNTAIGDRSFGSDPNTVASMVTSMLSGLHDFGVEGCLKHFPGMGDVTADPHDGSSVTDRTLEEMKATEFVPFQSGIDAGVNFIMVSHIQAPGVIGDDTPSSLSNVMITDILRGELGYNGIVITDALNMGAITDNYSSSEAAVKAVQAGADILLMPDNFEEAYQGIMKAVSDGTITEDRINESLHRIFKVKYVDATEAAEATEPADTAEPADAAGLTDTPDANGAADSDAENAVDTSNKDAADTSNLVDVGAE